MKFWHTQFSCMSCVRVFSPFSCQICLWDPLYVTIVLLFQIPKFFIVSCFHKYAFPAAISLEFVGIMQLKSLKYGSGWGCLGIWRTCNQTSKTDFQEGVPCTDLPPQHQKILIKMVFDNIFIIKSYSFACPQAFAYQLRHSHMTFYDLWPNHCERVYNFTARKPVYQTKREFLFAWLLRRC